MKSLRAKYFILTALSTTLMVTLWLLSTSQSRIDIEAARAVNWKRKSASQRDRKRVGQKGRNDNGDKIYVMAWRYSGQVAAGIQGVASLQCWAGQSGLPMEVIEPVMRHSELTSSLNPDLSDFMRLGDYFDLRHLNHVSRKSRYAQVITQSEFLKKAPKHVIFVRSEVHDSKDKVVWASRDGTECYTEGRSNQVLRRSLSKLQQLGYCVVKVVITAAGKLSHSKLMDIIGEWRQRSVILIVSLWKGPMALMPTCKGIGSGSALSHFHPSPRLLHDAQRYNDLHIRNSSYTAVMIRLEHAAMLVEKKPHEHSIGGCLQELVQSAEKASRRTGGHLPMVAADIGKYGSNTWKWAIKDQEKLKTAVNDTRLVIDALLQHQTSFGEWEDTFVEAAGGVTNEGYIAALQRTIASRADCLVLMGGGSFQQSVLQEYVDLHGDSKDRCIRMVCLHFPQQMASVLATERHNTL